VCIEVNIIYYQGIIQKVIEFVFLSCMMLCLFSNTFSLNQRTRYSFRVKFLVCMFLNYNYILGRDLVRGEVAEALTPPVQLPTPP
jgi:hypothetical protein